MRFWGVFYKRIVCILPLAASYIFFYALSVQAAPNMSFNGVLIAPPPCSINNGEDIAVLFGPVGVNKVDGINYLQDINYRIHCEDQDAARAVSLMVNGTTTSFDRTALQTNVAELGIKLLQNGNAVVLNQALVIDPASPPKLQAVPVKTPGSILTEQAFEVTATLQANYQ